VSFFIDLFIYILKQFLVEKSTNEIIFLYYFLFAILPGFARILTIITS